MAGKETKYSITFTATGEEGKGLVDGNEATIVLDLPQEATHIDTLTIIANGLAILLAAECIDKSQNIEDQLERAKEVCKIVSEDLQDRLMVALASQGNQGVVRA